jgi:3-oxoacyl-[acyl-carrier protein] reductase
MIILTGASGGIGHAILPALTKLDNVIAIYNNKLPDISELDGVTAHKVDLTSEHEVTMFTEMIKDQISRVTLIHAAALSRDCIAARFSTEDWDQVLNVNLKGNFLLTRAMLIPMIEEKWGRVIHISSVSAMRGVQGTFAYSTSKTGLLGMSRVLANEYARFGITSNVVVPGYFNAGLIDTLTEKARKKIMEAIPSGKLGDPINIVNAVEFILKSEYVNGSVINIDGGI